MCAKLRLCDFVVFDLGAQSGCVGYNNGVQGMRLPVDNSLGGAVLAGLETGDAGAGSPVISSSQIAFWRS